MPNLYVSPVCACVCVCACMFVGTRFSSGVYMNARYKDLWRKIISLKRYSHYVAGYAEGLPARRFYCTLCCKVSRNKSSPVVTLLRSARLSPPPIRPGGWIFQKATTTSVCSPPPSKKKLSGKMQQGTETPQRLTLNPLSRSKRITNWISMWYIHYREILCCSPLKAHHPPLPSLAHTPGPSAQTPAPPAPHRKTAYAGSSQLG